jgi:hypothetical protein
MTDSGMWSKLEDAQEILVDVTSAHPNMTGLAIACGPFFDWMHTHDPNGAPAVTVDEDGTITVDGSA